MNFGSDQRVRDAFRATLQGEPSSGDPLGTQEIDANDVIEVTDLANAIARAEEAIRARSSRVLGVDSSARDDGGSEDMFDKLVANTRPPGERVATDDTIGPARHICPSTPLPPRAAAIPVPPGVARRATLLRAPEEVFATPIPSTASDAVAAAAPRSFSLDAAPVAAPSVPHAPPTGPTLILDEDAFYHPAGRIRTLADGTLENYRPEPTRIVRLRERRNLLKWVVIGIVGPLTLLAIFTAALGVGAHAERSAAPRAASVPASTVAASNTAEAAPEPHPAVSNITAPALPVFDVKSLQDAPPTGRRSTKPIRGK